MIKTLYIPYIYNNTNFYFTETAYTVLAIMIITLYLFTMHININQRYFIIFITRGINIYMTAHVNHKYRKYYKLISLFYVDFFSSPAGWKLIEAELMQKRFLVGFGPSLNTCPRCASHFEQVTSVRTISGFAISSSRLPPTSWRRLIRRDARFSVVFFFQ